MTQPVSSELSTRYDVYVGTWTNWSRGPIFGATLTLRQQDGALLIAFLAFFVTVAGTSFWRLACFLLHLVLSSEVPSDGLHHQRQAVLRNSANAISGLSSLLQTGWAWRKTAKRPYGRTVPLVVFTALCIAAFATASGFSSKISTSIGNEVLLSGTTCGSVAPFKGSPEGIEMYDTFILPWIRQNLANSANYAQQCYFLNDSVVMSGVLDCNLFIIRSLDAKIDRNASCPFSGGICKRDDSNLFIDTGIIDSHEHLGLNSRPDERITFRRTTHCAPLETKGRKKTHRYSNGKEYVRYYFGEAFAPIGEEYDGFTYEYPVTDSHGIMTGSESVIQSDYTLSPFTAQYYNGSYIVADFFPSHELNRTDALIDIFFLSANNIIFMDKVDDDWYSAHVSAGKFPFGIGTDALTAEKPVYLQDDAASVLACAVQEQFCSPSLLDSNSCIPISSPAQAWFGAEKIWKTKQDARFFKAFQKPFIYQQGVNGIAAGLGIQALKARDRLSMSSQSKIPDDQWKLEMEFWHAITMAQLQSSFVLSAAGTSDPEMGPYITPPSNAEEKQFCRNQKIRSTAYTSFSLFWLYFILATGSVIIVLSYAIEPLISYILKRRRLDKYSYKEWCTNETLQLQRLAHEELGVGTWINTGECVPITKPGERLATLDLTDPSHPRLKAPPPGFDVLLSCPATDTLTQDNKDKQT